MQRCCIQSAQKTDDPIKLDSWKRVDKKWSFTKMSAGGREMTRNSLVFSS